MAARALPVGLLLITLLMDARGSHQTAFYVLVLALTAAAVGALNAFGELVELPSRARGVALARLDTGLVALGAVLVLVAAGNRGQTSAESVPTLAVSATTGALLLLTPAALVRAAAPLLRRAQARSVAERRRTSPPSREAPPQRRRAA